MLSSRTAFFYLFDAENDPESAVALFGQIEAWAKARRGEQDRRRQRLSAGGWDGVLVAGFEHHPAVGIPYNHAYYGELIERAGYTRECDFYVSLPAGQRRAAPTVRDIAEKMMARRGFSIRTFASKSELRAGRR